MTKFYIKDKLEFIVTFAHNYWGSLVFNNCTKLWPADYWLWVGSIEQDHESLDHEHYHFYLKYIGKNKKGFSTRKEDIWDVPLLLSTKEHFKKYDSDEWPLDKEIKKWKEAILISNLKIPNQLTKQRIPTICWITLLSNVKIFLKKSGRFIKIMIGNKNKKY